MKALSKVFPFFVDIKQYSFQKGKADFISGLTVAIVAMPQAMAYAMIAGLSPVYGLYASILPVIITALFGSSSYLVAGPTNALSMLVYSVMTQIYITGIALNVLPETLKLKFLFLITICMGILQCVAGVLRLGRFSNAISHAVILGFSTGAYLLIGFGQMKNFLGIHFVSPHDTMDLIFMTFQRLTDINFYTFFIAFLTLTCLICLKKYFPRSPHALLSLAFVSLVHYFLQLIKYDVALCPSVPQVLPSFFIPSVSFLEEAVANVAHLVFPVFTLTLLASVESIAIGRSMAIEKNQAFSADQELIGGGLGNIASGLSSAMPSCGSFSRSAVNFKSGAQTRFASLWSGIFVLLALLLFADFVGCIPVASLSALLVYICWNMLNIKEIQKTLLSSKVKASIFSITFLSVFFLGLVEAIFTGIAISFLLTNIRKKQRIQKNKNY